MAVGTDDYMKPTAPFVWLVSNYLPLSHQIFLSFLFPTLISLIIMDNILLPNGAKKKVNTSTTKKKKKKNPVRVVYISNPMKFNTSAAEFRALVQQLTGQDSDPTKLLEDPDFYDVGHQTPPLPDNKIDGGDDDDDDDDSHQVFSLDPTTSTTDESPDPPSLPPQLFAEQFDEYDDVFMPLHHQQVLENNIPLPEFIFSDFSHGDLLRGV